MSVEGHRHDQYSLTDHVHAAGVPAAHAASHASAGSDPVTIAESQVTNLVTDLASKAASVHTHAESDVTSLVSDLALKAPLASPALTGTPTAPTAAVSTNTTQVATTAFVIGQGNGTAATIAMNGTQAAGTSSLYARADHVHPVDTSRAPLASPSLTGTPLSTTAAVDTNTTQIATTAFVVGQAASVAPLVNGTAGVGTSLRYARQDHVHPSDTTHITNPGAWTSYTPTVTGFTTVTTTNAGYYVQLGKTVHVRIKVALTTVTTLGTGIVVITLPVNAATTGMTQYQNTLGTAMYRTNAGAFSMGLCQWNATGSFVVLVNNATAPTMSRWTGAAPTGQVVGDSWFFNLTYEAA